MSLNVEKSTKLVSTPLLAHSVDTHKTSQNKSPQTVSHAIYEQTQKKGSEFSSDKPKTFKATEVATTKPITTIPKHLLSIAEKAMAQEYCDRGKLYYNRDWEKRDYKTAHAFFQRAAIYGNAEAQYHLGMIYHFGLGVEQNPVKARGWYKEAAEQGNADAQFYLGELFYSGQGIEKSIGKAIECFVRAAAKGHDRALEALRVIQAESLLKRAEAEDAQAQLDLGKLHYYGDGVEVNYVIARDWFEKAAKQKNAEAQCYLGEIYWHGDGVERNCEKALGLFEEAAAHENANAQFYLGILYQSGDGVQKDYTKAHDWFEKAAIQGDAGAQCHLGELFYMGQGVEKNTKKAREWLKKAFVQGYKRALEVLRWIHDEEINDLTKKAESGDEQAARTGHVQSKIALEKFDKESENPLSLSYSPSMRSKAQKEEGILVEPNKEEARDRQIPSKQHREQNPSVLSMQKKEGIEHAVSRLRASSGLQDHTFVENRRDLEESIAEGNKPPQNLYTISSERSDEEAVRDIIERRKRRLQKSKEKQEILKSYKTAKYYFDFKNTFNKVFAACRVLDTGMLGNAHSTLKTNTVDTVLSVTTMLEEWFKSIPVLGLLLKLLNFPLKEWNDFEKSKAVFRVANLFDSALSYERFGELIARQLTLAQTQEIEEITTTKSGFIDRQLEKIQRLKNKLFSIDDVDSKLKSFAEEQCGILLIAFMKGEIKGHPEPKDVPVLVAKILKKEPVAIPVELSLGLGGGPVSPSMGTSTGAFATALPPGAFDPGAFATGIAPKGIASKLNEIQEARKEDHEETARLNRELEKEKQERIALAEQVARLKKEQEQDRDKYQKRDKILEFFMRTTFLVNRY